MYKLIKHPTDVKSLPVLCGALLCDLSN